MMLDVGGDACARDQEISLWELVERLLEWWWLILSCAVLAVLLGLIHYLSSEERFIVRMDVTIPESPLGSAAFMRDVSANFLRRRVGTTVVVEIDPRTGAISLEDRQVAAEDVPLRRAAMRNAVSFLRDFFDGAISAEYEKIRTEFVALPDNPEAYASLRRYRLHVLARESGGLESVAIAYEDTRRRGLPVLQLLPLAALAGGFAGTLAGLTAGAWRDRRRVAASR